MTRFTRQQRFLVAVHVVDVIIRVVSAFYGIPEEEIRGPKHHRGPSRARAICMFIIRGATGISYQEIGRPFLGRDHATVRSAIMNVEAWIVRDPQLRVDLLTIARAAAVRLGVPQLDAPEPPPQISPVREEAPAPASPDESPLQSVG